MSTAITVADQSAALVRRARAGDENAMATLVRIGEEARKGTNARAQAAFAAVKRFIDQNPAKDFVLGAEPPAIAQPAELQPPPQIDPELRKPPLPRGALDSLFDSDQFAIVVLNATRYRHGLNAAAAVLAAGPLLTQDVVQELGLSQFGSDESSAVFFHGVKNSSEQAWRETAPQLDAPMRRCLAIGQCVGRARRIQAVRTAGMPISVLSPVAGWELGE